MDKLDLTAIRILRAIVEAGSFTGAADRLGLAPPMVSKHIARLERQLGARLIHRTSRRMSLTEAGAQFDAQCRQALDILDAAVGSVGQASLAPRGELKISAPVWCATPRFAQVLAAFRSHYPEVRLDLHLDNRLVDLVSEGFDVALRLTAEPQPNLVARRLCDVPFLLVATPQLLARWRAGAEAGAVPPLPMVVPNYLQLERLPLPALKTGPATRMDPVMKSSDTTLTHHAVMAHMGAALLPDWLVGEDLAAGRLVRVHQVEPADLLGTLHAVVASRRQMPPKLRCFMDFLQERLGRTVADAA
jgi:DNA-binding transcriptional LysR family regulator